VVAEPPVERDRRWHLEDQRDFLDRSLADLEAERSAGDIGPEDYEALLGRDRNRLAAVVDELAQLDRAEDAERAAATAAGAGAAMAGTASDEEEAVARGRARRRRPRWLAALALAALAAGATLLVMHLTAPRLPGQPATGSTPQDITAELNEAASLVNQGTSTSLSQALALYRNVLASDPNQPQALAETGYLEWEAGFTAGDRAQERQGRSLVERSLAVQPDDYAAHLFLGTMDLEQGHDAATAVKQYRAFLAEHPPRDRVSAAAKLIAQAFTEAGQPLPSGVRSG
jgi:tetratricopeptide (TPR) repeat protein